MRYILAFILSVSAIFTQAQQVNPVTDYTFANRMSSGRSTVTDTAAYFSIGPRYGAVRGMMPPMVTDTTAMSANKRNGLLIFSIQKNKYQVWDSAGAKWADITGAAGSAIISADTAAMLLPYLHKADTTAMLSPYLRGSGTANYLPIFDATRSVINSKVYQTGTNLLFNTTTASFTSAGISTIENNATSSAVYTFKTNDSLRAYIGWGGASTMDINNLRTGDIRFYTSATLRGRFQTDGTFRLNSLTGTGSRIVTADADGVLSATSSATGLVDTTVLSTRAWRQKGDDSLGAIIATKGSGTVTSVATGYGLSGGTITTTGTISADTLQLSTRAWRQKGLDSLAALEISGSGTTNYVPKFTDTRVVGNSSIFQSGSNLLLNTATLRSTGYSSSVGQYGSEIVGIGGAQYFSNQNDVDGSYVVLGKTRGTAIDAVTSVSSGDILGGVVFQGTDGTTVRSAAMIRSRVDGTPGSGDMPGRLEFFTSADGTATLSERMRIDESGDIGIGTTSPTARVDVRGSTSDIGYRYIETTTGATNRIQLGAESGIGYIEATSGTGSPVLAFRVAGSERARLNLNAELLLNTTTDAGDYKLQVNGNAYINGTAQFQGTIFTRPGTDVGIQMVSTSAIRNSGTQYHDFGTGGSGDFYIRGGSSFGSYLTILNGGNVGIGTASPSASAQLDVFSTTRGFLPPRMTTTQRDAISSPAAGLVIYNTTTSKLQVYTTSWTDLH